jgi:hypothetical protein
MDMKMLMKDVRKFKIVIIHVIYAMNQITVHNVFIVNKIEILMKMMNAFVNRVMKK